MQEPPKIILYGETEKKGSGAWCYYENLKKMGFKVISYSDSKGFGLFENKPGKFLRKLKGGIPDSFRRKHINQLFNLAENEKPDIIIVLKGLFIGKNDVLELKKNSRWVVNINHDDFFSLNKSNRSDLQFEAIPYYDFIFTTREVNVNEIKSLNQNVEFFPFAYYPEVHRLLKIENRNIKDFKYDVVFIGTWEKERAHLLEELVEHVPGAYAIFGSQWNKINRNSPLQNYVHKKELIMEDMAEAISNSKIALGFLRKENRDDYTQRTFEIPACGGVLLAERTKRHLSFYKEGIEAEFFNPDSVDELIEKVGDLLKNNEKREAIRIAGMEALRRQKHTYKDRLNRLIKLYYSCNNPYP